MLDTAVIGAGMAGAAVAAELELAGRDYKLLEAGPHRGRAHIAADEDSAHLADPAQDPSFAPFLAQPGALYGPLSGYRRRVGGRSLYWRGICLRVEDDVLREWPDEVRRALLGTGDDPGLYAHIEAALRTWCGGIQLTQARTTTEAEMVKELAGLGYPAVPTPRAIRTLGQGRWEAYSPVTDLPSERILAGHRVSAVRKRPGGYSLVLDDGDGPALAARHVVLCAGTVGNIELVDGLLHGRGREPRRYSLVDHVACGMLVVDSHGRHEAMESSVYAGFDAPSRSNLIVERQRHGEGVLLDAWAMGEQPPEATSTVLAGDATSVTLEPAARAALDAVRRDQRHLLGELARRTGLTTRFREEYVSFDEALARAEAEPGTAVSYDATIGELDHESGGLPLDGEHVDVNGQLREAPEVAVAGPCLFPRAGAANPSLTTLALARYVVQRMR
ncbi:putative flavin-containing monooxygenase [Streptomyces sp. NBRC 110611]|uniref:NAD(P)-binding protein n=1 Tax=Streptomyces sp. NBRC 110611 TaxID=1621259 RepID=UPI0008559EDE|nr:NAD(P)-binding protein [Streptomyces sp. NBRC 110611]GAU67184.1 putative flavin-containing monooxygenase [Streptomyces sp. NBRC 110611]